jgi:nitrogenase molybdenum-iron protein alpha/beta subunit
MKGLLKRLTPFAPDQSGAAAALYELGGILVICDAGGCAGNVCGFDEPRWFESRSAVFSAGLRDMDAILGRDDKLIAKLKLAADEIDAPFAAVIGTPVPAVIGTDFRALRRMGEKHLNIPVLSIPATGVGLYDQGAAEAYLQLFQTFAAEKLPVRRDVIGVLGATPLDMGRTDAGAGIDAALRAEGAKTVRVYGMGSGLGDVRRASEAGENIVAAPDGIPAAEYLKKTFGTPWRAFCPNTGGAGGKVGRAAGEKSPGGPPAGAGKRRPGPGAGAGRGVRHGCHLVYALAGACPAGGYSSRRRGGACPGRRGRRLRRGGCRYGAAPGGGRF